MNQDRFALYFESFKRARLNRSAADATGALPIYDHAIKVGQRTQRQLGQILSVVISMKRTVEVGAGIRHHLDFPNLKLSARRVMLLRLFATKEITNDRRGQAFIGDQAIRDRVAEVYEFFGCLHLCHTQRK